MPKEGKKYVKPGYLAANTAYERLREKNINENNEILKVLGCKQLARSHFGSTRPNCTNKKGKKSMDTEYDEDYIPSDGEGDCDGDDDSSDSLVHEVIEMPPRKRLTYSEPSTSLPAQQRDPIAEQSILCVDEVSLQHVDERGNLPDNSMETPSSEPQGSSVGSTARRGATRGIGVQRSFEKEGKLLVPIPSEFRQPVGKYSTAFANAAGVQIRQHLADVGVRRWSKVPATSAEPIIQRLNDKFELRGDPVDVKKATNAKIGKRLSDWSSKNYKKYQKLVNEKGEPFARSHPPKGVTLQQWIQFIDGKWNNPDFQRQSVINTANRARVKMNHSCGSKSIPARLHKLVEENSGKDVVFEEFWRDCHFNTKENRWANPECESEFEKIKKAREDHLSQPNATQPTAIELSVKAFGTRSGCLKGLGIRASSIKTIVASTQEREHVSHLEERLLQLEAANQSKDEQLAEKARLEEEKARLDEEKARLEEEKRKKLEEQMRSMLDWMRSKGYEGPGS